MHFNVAFAALALAGSVTAHTRMWSVWVNGEDQGDGRGTYIRSPETNSPVKDVTSPDLVCNTAGGTPVRDFVTAAAGDKLSFEWYHDNRNDDIIDSSHKGPVITYIAAYTEDNGASPIWSKIDEEGYDSSSKLWAVDNLITNKGKKDFTLPSSLKAGQYLVRQEVIGLHEADASYTTGRGAQFYPSCVQMKVTGSGSAIPDEDFDINTGYTANDPGILFNLYGTFTSYDIPGPELWDGAGSGSGSSSSGNTTSSVAPTSSAAPTPTASSSYVASPTSSAASTTSAAPGDSTPTSVASSPSSYPSPSAIGGGSCRRKRHT